MHSFCLCLEVNKHQQSGDPTCAVRNKKARGEYQNIVHLRLWTANERNSYRRRVASQGEESNMKRKSPTSPLRVQQLACMKAVEETWGGLFFAFLIRFWLATTVHAHDGPIDESVIWEIHHQMLIALTLSRTGSKNPRKERMTNSRTCSRPSPSGPPGGRKGRATAPRRIQMDRATTS